VIPNYKEPAKSGDATERILRYLPLPVSQSKANCDSPKLRNLVKSSDAASEDFDTYLHQGRSSLRRAVIPKCEELSGLVKSGDAARGGKDNFPFRVSESPPV
jgi:hypothetical protein